MFNQRLLFMVLTGFFSLVIPLVPYAETEKISMPPRLTLNELPPAVLVAYPLGVVNQQAAFSHHGSAHRRLTLPNGNEGWIFNVGDKGWHRTYTLVFDANGMVSDVLYYDHSKHSDSGLSALQLQSKRLVVGGPQTGSGPK